MDRYKYLTANVLLATLSIPTITHTALIGRLAAIESGTDYQAYYDTEADPEADLNFDKVCTVRPGPVIFYMMITSKINKLTNN